MNSSSPESPLSIWAIAVPAILFVVIAIIEYLRPSRAKEIHRNRRWPTHLGMFLANSITAQLMAFLVIIPIAANWAQRNGFGLMHWLDLPPWAGWLIAFILLDFAVWFQHMVMHYVPFLWRAHGVHHSDVQLDLTSALRFHPFELILSTLYKSAWVALLGVPALVALAFELWLNGNAMFNHSNIRLPAWLDRIIRPVLVTPDMHIVHHSTDISEQNSNFGFALTIWDRLFGVYRPKSVHSIQKQGESQQPIGLTEAQDSRPMTFLWTILFPFRSGS